MIRNTLTHTNTLTESQTLQSLINEVYFLRHFFTNGRKKAKMKIMLSFTINFHCAHSARVKKITGTRNIKHSLFFFLKLRYESRCEI